MLLSRILPKIVSFGAQVGAYPSALSVQLVAPLEASRVYGLQAPSQLVVFARFLQFRNFKNIELV